MGAKAALVRAVCRGVATGGVAAVAVPLLAEPFITREPSQLQIALLLGTPRLAEPEALEVLAGPALTRDSQVLVALVLPAREQPSTVQRTGLQRSRDAPFQATLVQAVTAPREAHFQLGLAAMGHAGVIALAVVSAA